MSLRFSCLSGIPGAEPSDAPDAFLALRQAGFREGQSVLAPGAGGSVGNATLKVARALGASQLLSTAGSPAKAAAAAAGPSPSNRPPRHCVT